MRLRRPRAAAEDNRTTEPSRIQRPPKSAPHFADRHTNHRWAPGLPRLYLKRTSQLRLWHKRRDQLHSQSLGLRSYSASATASGVPARALPCALAKEGGEGIRKASPVGSSPWPCSPTSSTSTSPTAPRRSSPSTSGERCRLHSLLVASDPMPFRFRRQSPYGCSVGILLRFMVCLTLHGRRQAKENLYSLAGISVTILRMLY